METLPVDNILCEDETGLETALHCIEELFTVLHHIESPFICAPGFTLFRLRSCNCGSSLNPTLPSTIRSHSPAASLSSVSHLLPQVACLKRYLITISTIASPRSIPSRLTEPFSAGKSLGKASVFAMFSAQVWWMDNFSLTTGNVGNYL